MKELYANYIRKFEQAKSIADRYQISTEKADKAIADIQDFKVTVPIVGAFSTGKSSILNSVLGTELLATEITPETAVPAEISYGSDKVVYVKKGNDGSTGNETGDLASLNTKTLSIDKYDMIQITVNNDFLRTVPTIKIVDMPGFDSGYEVHNRAIDQYLPKSLAYIVAVSADEGTVRNSVLDFLTELKLNEMPAYALITKSDKIIPGELSDVKTHIVKTFKNHLGIENIMTAVTSAYDEECEEFKDLLRDLESKSDVVFKNHFKMRLLDYLGDIRSHLSAQLRVKDYSAEQIENEIERAESEIERLTSDLESKEEEFARKCENCVSNITDKVRENLENAKDSIINAVVKGNDPGQQINSIVRNTITSEIRSNFQYQVKEFLEDVNEMATDCLTGIDMSASSLSPEEQAENEQLKNTLTSAAVPVISSIATSAISSIVASSAAGAAIAGALGMTTTALGAVLGPLGIAVGAVVRIFINKGIREGEQQKKRQEAAENVSNAISNVCGQAETKIREIISDLRNNIVQKIKEEINSKLGIQKQALTKAKKDLEDKQQDDNERVALLESDLAAIKNMIDEEG